MQHTGGTFRSFDGTTIDHEVFDEPERELVLSDLTSWLDTHV